MYHASQAPLVIMISETITGDHIKNNSQVILNDHEFGLYAMTEMLVNRRDDDMDDFIYIKEDQSLRLVDNENTFDNEIIVDIETSKTTINVKNILFLLDNMEDEINIDALKLIINRQPSLIMLSWIRIIQAKKASYELLERVLRFQVLYQHYRYINIEPKDNDEFEPNAEFFISKLSTIHNIDFRTDSIMEINKFLLDKKVEFLFKKSNEDKKPESIIEMPVIYDHILISILDKLKKLSGTLNIKKNITYGALLEAVVPIVGLIYKTVREKHENIEQRILELNKNQIIDKSRLYDDIKGGLIEYQHQYEHKNKNKKVLCTEKNELIKEIDLEYIFESYNNAFRYYINNNKINPIITRLLLKSFIRDVLELNSLSKLTFNNFIVKNIHRIRTKAKQLFDIDIELQHDWDHIWDIIAKNNPQLVFLYSIDKYFILPNQNEIQKYFQQISHNNIKYLIPSHQQAVVGLFSYQRIISPLISTNMFSKKKSDFLVKHGRSIVLRHPIDKPELYFKKNPEFPLFEYAAITLMQLLGITDVPESEIFLFTQPTKGSNTSGGIDIIPILVSQAINGTLLHDALKADRGCLTGLDHSHTARLILISMLLNPEDGKDDNFILAYDPKRLIPIDNDHCLLPSSICNNSRFNNRIERNLLTKTILFCLDEMKKPLPKDVYDQFKNINVDLTLSIWLSYLCTLEETFQNNINLDIIESKSDTILKFYFANQVIEDIYYKFKTIQEILTPTITPFEILKYIEPLLWKKYHESFTQKKFPNERFDYVCQDLYKYTSKEGSFFSILDSWSMINLIDKTWLLNRQNKIMSAFDAYNHFEEVKKEWALKESILKGIIVNDQDVDFLNLSSKILQISLFFAANDIITIKKLSGSQILPQILSLGGCNIVNFKLLQNLIIPEKNFFRGYNVKYLDLSNTKLVDDVCLILLKDNLPNIQYLDLSGVVKLNRFHVTKWVNLQRVKLNNCLELRSIAILKCKSLVILEARNTSKLKWNITDILNPIRYDTDANDDNGQQKQDIIRFETCLSLNKCKMEYSELCIIFEVIRMSDAIFEGLSTIKCEFINENERIPTMEFWKKVIPSLNLRTLTLINCKINDEIVLNLVRGLLSIKNIKLLTLDLSYNSICDKGAQELGKLIIKVPLFLCLNLSNNNITNVGSSIMSSILKKSNLLDLNLSDNPIMNTVHNQENIYLKNTRSRLNSIKALKVDNMTLKNLCSNENDSSILLIQRIVEYNSINMIFEKVKIFKILELQMIDSQINEAAILKMTQYLALTNIEKLGFCGTHIPIEPFKILLDSMHLIKTIRWLDLTNTNLSEGLMNSLANMIENSTSLLQLDLTDNKISDVGAKIIANALPKSNLITLYLIGNSISKVGGQALIDVVALTSLIVLWLDEVSMNILRVHNHHKQGINKGDSPFLGYNISKLKRNHFSLSTVSMSDKMRKEILESILSDCQIEIFDCSFNSLKILPLDEVHLKSKLIILNLEGNQIEKSDQISLIMSLKYLEILNLQSNLINSKSLIPLIDNEKILGKKLIQLNLKDNKIDNYGLLHLKMWIIKQNRLISLNLSDNQYEFQCLKKFFNDITNSNILQLSTDYHNELIFDDDFTPVSQFKTTFKYHSINTFSEFGLVILANILPETSISNLNLEAAKKSTQTKSLQPLLPGLGAINLKALNLAHNLIRSRDIIFLCNLLPRMNLENLNLSGNNVDSDVATILFNKLTKTQLISLELKQNKLGDSGISSLCRCLPDFKKLIYLNLEDNLISNDGADALANVIKDTNLLYLSLESNAKINKIMKIELCNKAIQSRLIKLMLDESIESELIDSQLLPQNSRLYVSLADFTLNRISVKILCELLQKSIIKELDLSNCGLNDQEICLLAKNMNKTNIIKLNLQRNKISSEGLIELLTSLNKENFEVLNLEGNQITGTSLLYFMKINFSSLSYLNLKDNKIDDIGIEYLLKWLPTSTLKTLQLEMNPFNKDSLFKYIDSPNFKKSLIIVVDSSTLKEVL